MLKNKQMHAISNLILNFHGQEILTIIKFIDKTTACTSIVPEVYIWACCVHLMNIHHRWAYIIDEYTWKLITVGIKCTQDSQQAASSGTCNAP